MLKFVRRNAKPKKNAARRAGRAARKTKSQSLFQLALSLLGKIEMLLDDFGILGRKRLQVRISSALCFFLELSQVRLMVLHHHIHVTFVRFPFARRLYARERDPFLLCQRHQFTVRLGMIGYHSAAEFFYIRVLAILPRQDRKSVV